VGSQRPAPRHAPTAPPRQAYRLGGVDDKFSSSTNGVEGELAKATVGLVSAAEFARRRQELESGGGGGGGDGGGGDGGGGGGGGGGGEVAAAEAPVQKEEEEEEDVRSTFRTCPRHVP